MFSNKLFENWKRFLKEEVSGYKYQLFVPKRTYKELTDAKPIKNFSEKPGGGFWTSTAIDKGNGVYSSEWVEWCIYNMPEFLNKEKIGILLEVTSSKVLHIKFSDNYKDLARKYPSKEYKRVMSPLDLGVDWENALKHYDGIHLENYEVMRKYMYGWSVESTIWSNLSGLKFVDKVKIDV